MEVEEWFFNFQLSSWSSSQEIALRATDSWWTCTEEVLKSLYTQKICTPKIKTTEIGAHPGDNTKLILNLDSCKLSCTVQTNWPQTCPLSVGRPILSDTSPIALHPKNENPISSWWVATFYRKISWGMKKWATSSHSSVTQCEHVHTTPHGTFFHK